MTYIDVNYSKNYGMVKIIPPKQEKLSTFKYEEMFEKDKILIKHPYEQNVQGKGGVYESLIIV